MMNLRELTSDQEAILAQVESGDFTLDDVSDHLEMLESERNKKIESYLFVINRLATEEQVVQVEIDRLEVIRQQKAIALLNTKDWLMASMKDGEKHEFDLFKVSRSQGREVVHITDANNIPMEYMTVKPESWHIDKRLVLAELKKGVEFSGAEIVRGKSSLRIK
jgi:hypothetical protein